MRRIGPRKERRRTSWQRTSSKTFARRASPDGFTCACARALSGTPERPRLCVYRSNGHIYAQVIDDRSGRTLVSASSIDKETRKELKGGGNVAAAKVIGKEDCRARPRRRDRKGGVRSRRIHVPRPRGSPGRSGPGSGVEVLSLCRNKILRETLAVRRNIEVNANRLEGPGRGHQARHQGRQGRQEPELLGAGRGRRSGRATPASAWARRAKCPWPSARPSSKPRRI